MKGPSCKVCKGPAAWLVFADYLDPDPYSLCGQHYNEFRFFQELDS